MKSIHDQIESDNRYEVLDEEINTLLKMENREAAKYVHQVPNYEMDVDGFDAYIYEYAAMAVHYREVFESEERDEFNRTMWKNTYWEITECYISLDEGMKEVEITLTEKQTNAIIEKLSNL